VTYGFLDDEPDRSEWTAADYWAAAQDRLGLRDPMSAYVTDTDELLHTACHLLAAIYLQLAGQADDSAR
jgi:hypothetical protein